MTNSEVTNNDLENVFVKVTQEAASQVSTLFASLFAARVEKLPSDDGSLVLPSPFLESELFDIEYDQSGDIITLTHPNHRPQELRRYDATDYQIVDIALEPPLPAPTGLNAATIDRGRFYAGQGVRTSASSPAANPDRLIIGVDEEGTPFAVGDTVFLETDGQLANTYYEVSSVEAVGTSAQGVNEISFRSPTSGTSVTLDNTNLGTATNAKVYYSILTADPDETYVVTAIDERNQESFASEELLVTNQVLSVPGAKTTLQWTPVLGAVRYNVYKKLNGVFGFIGESAASGGPVESFVDDGIGPSGDQTLLIQDTQIDESYQPRASARFEQRRCFGGSDNLPRTLFMSRSGTESSFSYRIPTLDSDRVSVDLASREAHVIRHIVPIQDLLMMTQQGEFRVTAINSDAIGPNTIAIRQQSAIGSNNVHPAVVNNTVVFCAARGGHAREISFRAESQGYLTGDLSLRASHLFDGFTLNDLSFSQAPTPILWFVSSSGKLLCLTYIPEERVLAWHQHETEGTIESVCSISEGDYDNVYVVVLRDGNRSIERLVQVREETLTDAVYLDGSVKVDGTNTGTNKLKIIASGLTTSGSEVTIQALDSNESSAALGIFDESDVGDLIQISDSTSNYRIRLDGFLPTTQVVGLVHHTGSNGEWEQLPSGNGVATFYQSDDHTIANNEALRLSSDGTLPTGVNSSTTYYAINVRKTVANSEFKAHSNGAGYIDLGASASDQIYLTNEPVKLIADSGGSLPSGLNETTVYYTRPLLFSGDYGIGLAESESGQPIVFGSGGSGTHTIRRLKSLQLEDDNGGSTPLNFSSSGGSGNHSVVRSIFQEASGQNHGLTTGFAVRTGAVVPGGLVADRTYFAIRVTDQQFKFANTLTDAQAGTSIQLTTPPSTSTLTVSVSEVPAESVFTGTLLDDLPNNLVNTATTSWAFARKTFSGFAHLANKTISVLMDGIKTVTTAVSASGTISLDDFAVKICGGLSYTSQAKTLPMSLEMEAGAQGRTKNVNQLSVRVEDCGSLKVGMDEADIKSVEELKDTELKTGEFRTHVPSTWDEDTQVVIEASGAAPASVLNITTQISIGD